MVCSKQGSRLIVTMIVIGLMLSFMPGSYPAINLTVNVASAAPSTMNDTATWSGGSEFNTSHNSSSAPMNLACAEDPSLNNTSPLVISRFRENGPGGATDEFVEIFNPSTSSHTVASATCTGGYGVFASAGNGTTSNNVSLVCEIPNGTVIPARGYYLCTGAGYTLSNLGRNGGSEGATATGDALIGCSGSCTGDIPNDAGLALINVADNVVVNTLEGFVAASIDGASFIVYDRVGFGPYGAGAPASSRPSLADNFCEGTCLRPVGDASTLPTCSNPTEVFPVIAVPPACYGQSGQYELLRRQTTFHSNLGTLHQDTNANTNDLLIVSPNPGINVGLNVSGVAGVKTLLGAATPQNSTANADMPQGKFTQRPFDGTNQKGPRNAERIYSLDPTIVNPLNAPLGTYALRFGFVNNSGLPLFLIRFRVDDLSTLCGPQSGALTVGTGNANNLSSTPDCGTLGFSAILKLVNSVKETVVDSGGTAQFVYGSVLDDLSVGAPPAPGPLSPLGGGIDNTVTPNPSSNPASVGDGVTGGVGQYNSVSFSFAPANVFRIKFKFGVVQTGRFILLLTPQAKLAPAPLD